MGVSGFDVHCDKDAVPGGPRRLSRSFGLPRAAPYPQSSRSQSKVKLYTPAQSVGKCISCAFWEAPEYPSLDNPEGQCLLYSETYGCPVDGWECSDPHIGLMTGPLFGCIHWRRGQTRIIAR